MRNIWDHKFDYTFFKPYIEWTFRGCYSKIEVEGLENIPSPEEASVIITPNHCNTLMDSLMVLQSLKDPVFFVSRADIFKKPFFAHILHNLRILPIYRSRDGSDSKERNVAVFDNVVEALNHNLVFCIHPEGTHRTRRSLLPMKKGVFRIAQQAAESNPDRPVYIIPTGLEYEDYFNIMRRAKVSFGEPMQIKGGEDIEVLSKELYDRISGLITFFPDDENLSAAEKAFYESRRPEYRAHHYLAAALLLPVLALSAFLCSPMLAITLAIKPGIKDKAWLNTLRFCIKLALTPFTVAGAAIAGFALWPWWAALGLVAATLYAHPLFYSVLGLYRRLILRH